MYWGLTTLSIMGHPDALDRRDDLFRDELLAGATAHICAGTGGFDDHPIMMHDPECHSDSPYLCKALDRLNVD